MVEEVKSNRLFLSFFMVLLFSVVSCGDDFTQSNKRAQEIMEAQLSKVEYYLNQNPDSMRFVCDPNVVSFLVNTTKIESESDGTTFGQFLPTENDFRRWTTWYKENRNRIFWDEKEQKVILID